MTIDISDFYLNTPLTRWEYVKLDLRDISDEIISEYNLKQKEVNGFVYVEVRKGMYSLPQSGLLSNKFLQRNLVPFEYQQSKLITGLWKHDWRPIHFTLVVNDFGVKYVGEKHEKHLLTALHAAKYRTKED